VIGVSVAKTSWRSLVLVAAALACAVVALILPVSNRSALLLHPAVREDVSRAAWPAWAHGGQVAAASSPQTPPEQASMAAPPEQTRASNSDLVAAIGDAELLRTPAVRSARLAVTVAAPDDVIRTVLTPPPRDV
jgi:hypothetical protein